MRLSVVIPTVGCRERALEDCLESLLAQTVPADEILVVDATDGASTRPVVDRNSRRGLPVRWIAGTTRGSSAQRNIGVRAMSADADAVLFLDDDVVLSPDYIQRLLGHFEAPAGRLVAGAAGVSTNDHPPRAPLLERAWRRLFIGRATGRPRLTRGGISIPLEPSSTDPVEAEWLFGCAMYRREVFEHHAFDETLDVHSLMEDVDLSLGAASVGQLIADPRATLLHHHVEGGRQDAAVLARSFMTTRYKLLRRHRPGAATTISFWWTSAGFVALWTAVAVAGRRPGRQTMRRTVRAACSGLLDVARGRVQPQPILPALPRRSETSFQPMP